MPRLGRLTACCTFLLLYFGTLLQAQSPAPKNPPKHIVGVILDSNFARIEELLPRMQEYIVKNVPQRMKSVELVAIDRLTSDPFSAARKANCDYLLQMTISTPSRAAAGVVIGGESFPDRNGAFSDSDNVDRRILESVVLRYRLASIHDDGFDKSDNDRVRLGEFPSTMDGLAFETTLLRAAERVTLGSLKQLPKQ